MCEWLERDLEKWACRYSLGKITPWKLRRVNNDVETSPKDRSVDWNPLGHISLLLEQSGINVSVEIDDDLEKWMKIMYVRNRNKAIETRAKQWLGFIWKVWQLGAEYDDYGESSLELKGLPARDRLW